MREKRQDSGILGSMATPSATGRVKDARVIPADVALDRAPVLRHTLVHLPSEMLEALVAGLEANSDHLIAGRLFESRTGGGCAVGVMLRELDPVRYGRNPLRYWLNWRRMERVSDDRKLATAHPRLRHLEHAFDTTVEKTLAERPELEETEVTRAVGLWFSAAARAELARRRPPIWPSRPRSVVHVDHAVLVGLTGRKRELAGRGLLGEEPRT